MKALLGVSLIAAITAVGATVVNPPEPAQNPSPANGETGVSLTPVLSWTPGAGATMHRVYFGTNPESLDLVATIVVVPPPTGFSITPK